MNTSPGVVSACETLTGRGVFVRRVVFEFVFRRILFGIVGAVRRVLIIGLVLVQMGGSQGRVWWKGGSLSEFW